MTCDAARLRARQCAVRRLLREVLGPLIAGGGNAGNNAHDQRLAEIATAIGDMQHVIERGLARPERVDNRTRRPNAQQFLPLGLE